MKLKSFQEFLNEADNAEGGVDKFKLTTLSPDKAAGEVASFRCIVREFDPQKPLAELAVGQAIAKPEFKKFADDKTLVAFIKIQKQRDAGALTPRELLKAVIVFKKAEGYDTTKAKPVATVGGFNVYDIASANQMNADDTTTVKNAEKEIKKEEPAVVVTEPAEVKTEEPKKEEEKKVEEPKKEEEKKDESDYVDVKSIKADDAVLSMLRFRLLDGVNSKYAVNNKKITEIKGLQYLVTKLMRADAKTMTKAADAMKKSGVDGVYGPGTAAAIGLLTQAGSRLDRIEDSFVQDLAKWCTLNKMTTQVIEKIFKDSTVSNSDGNTKGNANTGGKNYYFVDNAPN